MEQKISPTVLARKWKCNADTIRTWVRKAGFKLPAQYRQYNSPIHRGRSTTSSGSHMVEKEHTNFQPISDDCGHVFVENIAYSPNLNRFAIFHQPSSVFTLAGDLGTDFYLYLLFAKIRFNKIMYSFR